MRRSKRQASLRMIQDGVQESECAFFGIQRVSDSMWKMTVTREGLDSSSRGTTSDLARVWIEAITSTNVTTIVPVPVLEGGSLGEAHNAPTTAAEREVGGARFVARFSDGEQEGFTLSAGGMSGETPTNNACVAMARPGRTLGQQPAETALG